LLLTSHILRIFFWICRRFERALLWQSITMIGVQVMLLEALVSIKREKSEQVRDDPWLVAHFWNWTVLWPYTLWLGLFTAMVASLCLPLECLSFAVECVGVAGCTLEGLLAVPQIARNYSRKKTDGLSLVMVLGWTIGDCARLAFLVAKNAPVHFVASGAFQILADAAILVQLTLQYPSKDIQAGWDRLHRLLSTFST
jgi:hypothetical protein